VVDSTAFVDRVLVKHDFDMAISSFANLRDINQRSVSFFKGHQSDYVGINDPKLEEMVLQWRRTLDEAGQRKISADIQRLIADQLYWVNVTGYPFFQAYRDNVKNYPFYIAALMPFGTTWIEK
jgi:ABC-type transport system substrate-binding protein